MSDAAAKRLTLNQQAMLGALEKRDWRADECNAGQARTINSLINRGLAKIRRVGGIRWLGLTPEGSIAVRREREGRSDA